MRADKRPWILNFGMGVDSTAVIVGMFQRGMVPDLILFADTGGEKPETYSFLPHIQAWLMSHGWPPITICKYTPTRAPYTTLEGNCVTNETLPSIAFRGGGPGSGGCSLKFKAEVMEAWVEGRSRGPWKGFGWKPYLEAKEAGIKTVKFIGYDNSPADLKRTAKALKRPPDEKYDYRYPLQEWGWDRARCIEEIDKAGLPVPLKSACFFCPASKKWEVRWLAAVHPELFLRSIKMEDLAANGRNGLKPKRGLGINFRWRAYAEKEGFLIGDKVNHYPGLLEEALADKPDHENRDFDCEDVGLSLVRIGGSK